MNELVKSYGEEADVYGFFISLALSSLHPALPRSNPKERNGGIRPRVAR
jgi:hypothetical protein